MSVATTASLTVLLNRCGTLYPPTMEDVLLLLVDMDARMGDQAKEIDRLKAQLWGYKQDCEHHMRRHEDHHQETPLIYSQVSALRSRVTTLENAMPKKVR